MKITNLLYPIMLIAVLGSSSIAKAEKKQDAPKQNKPTQTCTQQYNDCLGNKKWWEVVENTKCSIEYSGCLVDKFQGASAPSQQKSQIRVPQETPSNLSRF